MIVMTVFLFIIIRTEFRLVNSRKENCHYDHILLKLEESWKKENCFSSCKLPLFDPPWRANYSGGGNCCSYQRTAVRETGSSRHHEACLKASVRSFRTSPHYCIDELKGWEERQLCWQMFFFSQTVRREEKFQAGSGGRCCTLGSSFFVPRRKNFFVFPWCLAGELT